MQKLAYRGAFLSLTAACNSTKIRSKRSLRAFSGRHFIVSEDFMIRTYKHNFAVRAAACAALMLGSAFGQVTVTTYHNDNSRTGQNLNETILTTANVNTSGFGRQFSIPVDGFVYAQPLYLSNVSVSNLGVHNVVYVATENDSVYAFDADSIAGSNASPLWHVSFLNAGATTLSTSDVSCTDITPQIGITGTPVIDSSSGTLYVVARTKENGTFVQRLHALDVTSGAEKFGGPVVIQASVAGSGSGSVNGQVSFDAQSQNQRAGLLLQNGMVYIAWGSLCDVSPYRGWIMAYGAQSLAQMGAYITSTSAVGGGVWESGSGLAGDEFFNVYFATGNGAFNANTGGTDYCDSVVKLGLPTAGSFPVADYFTPYNQSTFGSADLGSGGVLLLPDQAAGSTHPHLAVQAGKLGEIYLLDRDNMGHFNASGNSQIVQDIPGALPNGEWNMPAWWNNTLFYGGKTDSIRAYAFNPTTEMFSTTPSSISAKVFGYPGTTPSLSANGTGDAILWAVNSTTYASGAPAALFAYDASNLSKQLYSTGQNSARDNPGPAVKFTVPTVANGKVYLGTQTLLSVFGLFAASDFSMSATPASIRIRAKGNGVAQYTTTITPKAGYAGTVTLSLIGLPSHTTATFNPSTVTGSGTTTLTITPSKTTPLGTYTLGITGTDSAHNLVHDAVVTLVVD
jgi:hypothetical protein